jgi:2-amino-4-hydroxy-6-hydroxymethyldihydropteridine diphosphokinase
VSCLVYIGIGTNIGKKKENYREALERIAKIPSTTITKESSLYESEPHGEIKEWFVNGVIEIMTSLEPADLLHHLKNVERAMGRKPMRGKKWGSRVLDLDILIYQGRVVEEKGLIIPHPQLHSRKFVLVPLSEIAPQLIHPKFSMSISALLANVKDDKRVTLLRS